MRTGAGVFRTNVGRCLLVFAGAVASTSCAFGHIDCSLPPPRETRFTGTVVRVDRPTVTYLVDEVLDQGDPPVQPALDFRREVAVRYLDDDEQYLEIGLQYRVGVTSEMLREDGRPEGTAPLLSSSVDTASCLAPTRHTDDSAIDTGFFASPGTRALLRWVLGIAAALLVLGVGGAGISAFVDRRE